MYDPNHPVCKDCRSKRSSPYARLGKAACNVCRDATYAA